MNYLSVCSGIEAATLAWKPLGWRPLAFSEIEPFPCAVLAERWPDVPNVGDMLTADFSVYHGATDVLIGGTPCQSFSVAGLRQGLADDRGNLTMRFAEIANVVEPRFILWENVPGVLSSRDNAFGCLLGALAGEDGPLVPAGKKWTNAGYVLGPERAIAWRVLDAQYFGVAQRRRRVFLVACPRDGADPRQVLFESEGLRRDSPPSREARQDAAADAGCGFETAGTLDARTEGGGFPGSDGACQGHVVPVAACLDANYGKLQGCSGQDLNHSHLVPVVQSATGDISHALNTANNGKGSSEDGTGRGVPIIASSAKDYGGDAHVDVSPTVRAGGNSTGGDRPIGTDVDTADSLITHGLAVRRLMPVECERLQGEPDGHTAVTYRNKSAADGPRYKAIGNSMAVPCIRWIGERMQRYA